MTAPEPAGATDAATAQFLDYRELLFSVVYNMLASVADTEDVLQEVWLAWAARLRGPEAAPIETPRGYLVRIAANKALARRADLSRRREVYVGPWLPEPLVADEDHTAGSIERAQSLSTAVLVVLETLSPLERAVFVLHELFGFDHAEVAGIARRRRFASSPPGRGSTCTHGDRGTGPIRRFRHKSSSDLPPPRWAATWPRYSNCWRPMSRCGPTAAARARPTVCNRCTAAMRSPRHS